MIVVMAFIALALFAGFMINSSVDSMVNRLIENVKKDKDSLFRPLLILLIGLLFWFITGVGAIVIITTVIG